MTNKSILCIVEGEVTEIEILTQIKEYYIERDIEFIPFRTNIYHVYNTYIKEKEKSGPEIDMFIFLREFFDKENIIRDKKQNDFLGIYLFMDLEYHEPLARTYQDCIIDMLNIFNDPNENGLLYISYPMAEAFHHSYFPHAIYPFNKLGDLKKYKEFVKDHLCTNKINLQEISRENIDKIMINNIKQMNFLMSNIFCYPENYNIDQWSQIYIFEKLSAFINENKIIILSSFPFFLLEYLGEKLFLQWKTCDT